MVADASAPNGDEVSAATADHSAVTFGGAFSGTGSTGGKDNAAYGR